MKASFLTVLTLASCVSLAEPQESWSSPNSAARYATDAYPGFDSESEIVKPSKKDPKWFAWLRGPKRDNARDQMAYCEELVADENWSKAAKHLDALVRNWPTSPEAPVAQRRLAEITLAKLDDPDQAFSEYRYLADYFTISCDFGQVVDKMYQIADYMCAEGKRIVFFRFANTVDVRRAYEACVLRAPGAKWAPQAMLKIGALRVDEGKFLEAIKVFENLRNTHYGTPEARQSVVREAEVRMKVLRDRGYNRERCQDTAAYLRQARGICEADDVGRIQEWLAEVNARLEEDAYLAAKYYDSRMRTKNSAVSAYEQFLADYPESRRADEVKARLEVLKGRSK